MTPGELIAELLAAEIREVRARTENLGALVQDVPHLDAHKVLAALARLQADGIDLRIAYLLPGGAPAAEELGLTSEVFDVAVERAEEWRNEGGLAAWIVVVAAGDEPRLSSLREFEPVGPSVLKRRLADRGMQRFGELNEVQRQWWDMLGDDPHISLTQLGDYFLALDERPELEVIDQASREIHRLGLLPDPELFNRAAATQIRRRLEANRQVMGRLQTLSDKDRATIVDNIARQDDEGQSRLQRSLRQVQALRRGRAGERPTLGAAQELLGFRRPVREDGERRRSRTDGAPPSLAEVSADALVSGEGEEPLDAVLEAINERLAEIDDADLKPVREVVDRPGGEAQVQARADVVNLMAHFVAPERFGGWLNAQGDDIDEMIRRFQGEPDIVRYWTRETIDRFLASSEAPAVQLLAERFTAFITARNAVLGDLRALSVAPLLVAGAPTARARLLELVDAYEALLDTVRDHYAALADEFAGEVDALLGELLVLDTIVLDAGERTLAVLSPVHPLYLWHFAEFARLVAAQRAQLSPADQQLVAAVAADDLPNLLGSVSLPPVTGENALTLPYAGRLGPLPYFASSGEQSASPDGVKAIERLARAFLDVHPPSRRGLRLALVDPPDPSPYLLLLADLADEGQLRGGHITVLRRPREKVGTDLSLDADEEDRVARLFSAVEPGRPFTFEVVPVPAGRLYDDGHPPHISVAFDQTPASRQRVPEVEQPLQPLVLARKLQFQPVSQRVELLPAHGGPFAAYSQVAERVSTSLGASYHGRHQDEQLRERLGQAAQRAQWFALADRRVDRDLRLGALRIFTGREGERDIAAFATSTDAFRRALRDVAVGYNTAISASELDGLLDELVELLDAGVLWLRPGPDGSVNHAQVKGVLGTLIVARWWRSSAPEGVRRLVLSLDESAARRWLHLSDDPKRADLLGLEAGPDGVRVSVIEVKAVEAAGAEYRITDGRIEGDAVAQVLSTRRLLTQVFSADQEHELVTTPARRELIRANAHRELTKFRYGPDERRAWVSIMEEALAGQRDVSVTAHLVDVRIGANPDTLPPPRTVTATDAGADVPVVVVALNEREVSELRQLQPTATPPRDEAPPAPSTTPERPARPAAEGEDSARRQIPGEPAPAREQGEPTGQDAGPADAPAVSGDEPARPRAYLGVAEGAYGRQEEIFFDPELPDAPLPNGHVSITGETGSGKTQATKALLRDLMYGHGLPGLILDFKDDYSTPDYTEAEGLEVTDASFGGLPFNPLEPPIDPRAQRVAPMNHVHQLGEILRRVYRLGDQQVFHLREAIKAAYEAEGLQTRPFRPAPDTRWPSFEAVRPILEEGEHGALLGRLSPIFDLGLFDDPGDATLDDLLDGRSVVRLSQLPGDQVKNAVAEFLLLGLYNHLIRRPQPRRLQRLLVLDEAWRVTNSEWLEPLMREGRAFGLGVIIATQYPNDLSDAVAGATNTKLFFSQSLPEPVKVIQNTLVGRTSGPDAERVGNDVRGMATLHCLLQNNQYRPYRRVAVEPYFRRVS